jgi:hypothetical protein
MPYATADTPDELNAADPRYVSLSSTAADEGAPDSAVKVALSTMIAVLMMAVSYVF